MKPFVSVLMALYNPKIEWLKEILISVDEQTYFDLEILIQDDCSDKRYTEEIKKSIKGKRRTILFERNSYNMGSDNTYQLLMKKAKGKYIAFCDQDDKWDVDKIETLVKILESDRRMMLVYSDMRIINTKGEVISTSLKNYRRRIRFLYGENLLKDYFFYNCTAGCSMLVKREVIEKIDKIPYGTYWDHWVCIVASTMGEIQFEHTPRMSYRIHSNNQSGILVNISCKSDYYRLRVDPLKERLRVLKEIDSSNLDEIERCVDARCSKNPLKIWKNRKFCKKEAWFEMILPFMSDRVFQCAIEEIRKG